MEGSVCDIKDKGKAEGPIRRSRAAVQAMGQDPQATASRRQRPGNLPAEQLSADYEMRFC